MEDFPRNGGETTNSAKRKLKEMMASAKCNAVHDILTKERPPISFYDEDLLAGRPNHLTPFMVRTVMANFEVHWTLIDQGALCD